MILVDAEYDMEPNCVLELSVASNFSVVMLVPGEDEVSKRVGSFVFASEVAN